MTAPGSPQRLLYGRSMFGRLRRSMHERRHCMMYEIMAANTAIVQQRGHDMSAECLLLQDLHTTATP